MFGGETLISLFFKLFNFGLLIGVLIYYCKRYAIEPIKQKMAHKDEMLQTLQERKEQLAREKDELSVRYDHQEEYRTHLADKAERWRAAVIQSSNEYQQEAERIHEMLVKKIKLQEHNLYVTKAVQKALPPLLHTLTTDMEKHFSHEKEGQLYIDTLITLLERSI